MRAADLSCPVTVLWLRQMGFETERRKFQTCRMHSLHIVLADALLWESQISQYLAFCTVHLPYCRCVGIAFPGEQWLMVTYCRLSHFFCMCFFSQTIVRLKLGQIVTNELSRMKYTSTAHEGVSGSDIFCSCLPLCSVHSKGLKLPSVYWERTTTEH